MPRAQVLASRLSLLGFDKTICQRSVVMRPIFTTERLERAVFVERPNRFLVRVRRRSFEGLAYLANPGRLGEILLPGTELLLARRAHTRMGWEAVGATWHARWPGDRPRCVFLNAARINDVVARLLQERRIPELAAHEIERREYPLDRSRVDFLLRRDRDRYALEVKSVTLAEQGLAFFPDARTERARRHLEALADLQRRRMRAGVLFLVQGDADRFLPDIHNDLEFARTAQRVRCRVELLAYRLDTHLASDGRLVFAGQPRRLEIPWRELDAGLEDAGIYLLVLELARAVQLEVGGLGWQHFRRGFYVYVGSARRALSRRLERHLRRRKAMHWHVDHLRAASVRASALPIRGASGECELAAEVARIGDRLISRFGSSDCGCPGHLVHFAEAPVRVAAFQELLTRMRHTLGSRAEHARRRDGITIAR